jgi:hypothetical protein
MSGNTLIVNPSAGTKRCLTAAIVIVFNLCIYSLPTLMTVRTLKSRNVPVLSGADLSLYLNLSNVGPSREHLDLNPYFGTVMQPAGSIGYRTFDLAFRMFNIAAEITRYDLWSALFVWNLFWWSAIAVGAIWFWELTLPKEALLVQWLGVSLLLLFNFGVVRSLLLAWLHLPSLGGFADLNLPYSRAFFSQVPIAILLFYLVLQVRALRFGKWHSWAGMCLLQIAAFWAFPYATLLMALTTLVATVAWLASGPVAARLTVVTLYGAACGASDILFLLLRSSASSHSHSSFFVFHPWLLPTLTGGAALLLVALTTFTAAMPPVGSREVKWIICGLGIGNTALLFGDIVFTPELLVSHHGGYFLHFTVSLEIAYLLGALFAALGGNRSWFRVGLSASIALITINGAILALASGRYLLPLNQHLAGFARALGSANLEDGDLVVTSAETVDDLCAWVPLLSRGRVLFCRPAQYELSADEKRGLYRSRQAFYLYFKGKDTRWLEQVTSDPHASDEGTLLFADETTSSDRGYRDKGRLAIRTDLIPKMLGVEQSDSEMRSFFHPYRRVLVVEDAGHSAFVRERLESYFRIYAEGRVDNFALLWCGPK